MKNPLLWILAAVAAYFIFRPKAVAVDPDSRPDRPFEPIPDWLAEAEQPPIAYNIPTIPMGGVPGIWFDPYALQQLAESLPPPDAAEPILTQRNHTGLLY